MFLPEGPIVSLAATGSMRVFCINVVRGGISAISGKTTDFRSTPVTKIVPDVALVSIYEITKNEKNSVPFFIRENTILVLFCFVFKIVYNGWNSVVW